MTAAILAPLAAVAALATTPPPRVVAEQFQSSPVSVTVLPAHGTTRLLCAVDGRAVRPCGRSMTLRLRPGRHAVSVRAVDGRGRRSPARSVTIVVPEPAPKAVAIGGQPVGIAALGDDLWISGGSSGSVSRVDAAARRVAATVQIGGQLGGVATTPGAVWVSVFGGGQLVRIDPGRNAVSARIPLGGRPTGISVTPDGAVWVGNLDGYLSRLDTATGEVTRIAVPSGVSTAIYARSLLWVGLQNGSVLAIDPATRRATGSPTRVAADVDALVDTPAGIWVTTFSGIAALVDPTTRAVTRRRTLPGQGSGIAFGAGSVWASAYRADLVVRLDPATGAVLGAVRTGAAPRESVVVGATLWVIDQDDGAVTPIPLGR
jgi:streptogramin lyase